MTEGFRLHHIGILVADVARSSQLLQQHYGYVPESSIIEDARQTAFAQFLRMPGADHWTELVAPNGPSSVLTAALKQRRSGTHHVCYEVPNIDRACEHLASLSTRIISASVPGVAFGGRRIAWAIDLDYMLVELVEAGPGPLALRSISGEQPPASVRGRLEMET
jgi:methylmalonyl-CoA/ethylmalonyl-CoA epimerase